MRRIDEPVETATPMADSPKPGSAVRRWSTGFLIVGSALVGATAIALWNRRAIARLRAEIRAERPNQIRDIDSEIV